MPIEVFTLGQAYVTAADLLRVFPERSVAEVAWLVTPRGDLEISRLVAANPELLSAPMPDNPTPDFISTALQRVIHQLIIAYLEGIDRRQKLCYSCPASKER